MDKITLKGQIIMMDISGEFSILPKDQKLPIDWWTKKVKVTIEELK